MLKKVNIRKPIINTGEKREPPNSDPGKPDLTRNPDFPEKGPSYQRLIKSPTPKKRDRPRRPCLPPGGLINHP